MDRKEDSAAAGEPIRFWLWRNGDHFLAYNSLFPRRTDSADPAVIGEPSGWAFLQACDPDPRDNDPAEIKRAEEGIGRGWQHARLVLAARRLAFYADECALILRQAGYEGKASSLEQKGREVIDLVGTTPGASLTKAGA